MKKIQINYIPHNGSRFEYSKSCLIELLNIKEENKKYIKLNINSSYESNKWHEVVELFKNNNIKVSFKKTDGNYMNKIHDFIKSDCSFSCKWDDDIFISSNSWDYVIENIDYLKNNEDVLFLSPIITNGIPSVDIFVDNFFNKEEKDEYFKIIKKTNMISNAIANSWGVDYKSLNENTINSKKFNCDEFYKNVGKIKHHYKGIHPVRISQEIHNLIFNVIKSRFNEIIDNNNFDILKLNRPYFCNSMFFIETKIWKEIILDKSLYVDSFDEVPLNTYMKKYNKKMSFIKNSYAVHMAYNTIGVIPQKDLEKKYIKLLIENNDKINNI